MNRFRPVIVAIVLLVLASQSRAEDKPRVSLWAGAMQFAERGKPDKKDFVYRLSATLPLPAKLLAECRIDYTRTQDGGSLADINTFRSIEAFCGATRDFGAGFRAGAFSGVSWNQDDHYEPVDPRLWTAAVALRFDDPRGSILIAAGHHGPVGGSALMGAVVVRINDGSAWFFDFATPLDKNRFEATPYTIKFGVSARLWAH